MAKASKSPKSAKDTGQMPVPMTIERTGDALFKERGSRFLGFALALPSREALDILLQQYRAQFADATHVCYGYRFGNEAHASDDGEPAHSAGSPILRQIQAYNLTNSLVVVVRYYGGTKLGVPGLIHAYGAAAEAAIQAATLAPYVALQFVRLRCAMQETDSILRQLKALSPQNLKKSFDSDCTIEFFIRQDDFSALTERFAAYLALS